MNIHNPLYKTITIDWDAVALPLKAGSPIGLGGRVQNGSGAIGIVTQTVTEEPLIKTLRILIGGDVDLDELQAEYGTVLMENARKSMQGIRFFRSTGEVAEKYLTEVPRAGTGNYGTVKQAANVAALDATKANVTEVAETVNDLLAKLVAAGIMLDK